ncbi:hypothetical protein GW17_00004186 [Ensete ventricosum]|nr:hypothetical protein GW17_00004186 [Ensete ventricosum]
MLRVEPSRRQMITYSAALRCLLVLLLAGTTLGLGERLGAKECEDLGFTGLALCSDCNTLGEYVKDKGTSSSSRLGPYLFSLSLSLSPPIRTRAADSQLVSDCRKCCSEDSDDSSSEVHVWLTLKRLQVRFSGAILEVCMRKLMFYPEVAAFIEEAKDEFSYVKFKYAYASLPKLIMLDSEGNEKETIRSVLRTLL